MLSAGLNFAKKNKVLRLAKRGWSAEEIARYVQSELKPVQGLLDRMYSAAAPGDSDRFGPLPGSPEWDELSPGARSGLTRKRQNAERAQDADHSSV